MEILGVLAIIFSLLLMVFLIWKKVNVIVAATICAGILALLSGLNVLDALKNEYMTSLGNYVISFFPLFLLSATFGKVMQISGAADSVAALLARLIGAKYAIYIVMAVAMILTYGGVSVFVVVFAVYPIALSLFQKADLPRHLIPASIVAGACTLPNVAPGSPQLCHMIPTEYLGTDAMAAPVLTMIEALLMVAMALVYLRWQEKRVRAKQEHFTIDERARQVLEEAGQKELSNGWLALVPMAVVIISLNVVKLDVLVAMLLGIIVCAGMFWNKITDKMQIVNGAVGESLVAIMNTSAAVGFGGVAAATIGFATIVNWVTTFSGPPLLSYGIATTLMAGATGSGSAGLSLAMENLVPKYLAMGVSPEALHAIGSLACIGLDSLPHNGFQITLLAACGLTHKEGYKHSFWITVIIPLIALFISIAIGTVMYPVA